MYRRTIFILKLPYTCHVCYSKSMDQPGKVASPARGQLIKENEYFPVPVRACESGLARRVRQSRPASACSSPYSGEIWCLYVRDSSRVPRRRPFVYLKPPYAIGSVPSLSGHAIKLRTDGVHCRESAGIGPVNLKVVPPTGVAFSCTIIGR